jgi:hypothetical protein
MGDGSVILILLSVVQKERMMSFWVTCQIVVVMVTRMLRDAVAAGPLLRIYRLELAGALVVRTYPALQHLRRRGRIRLIGSMARFELVVG